MIRTTFNDGWEYRRRVNAFAEMAGAQPSVPITLPHDATISQPRAEPVSPSADQGAQAYFPGGEYEYRKRFTLPADSAGKRVLLEFEGVYRHARVYLNGVLIGARPSGYAGFTVLADPYLRAPGEENVLRVEAQSGADSRWYTGCGIYRDVWLHTGDLVHVAPDALTIRTVDVDHGDGHIEVVATITNDTTQLRTLRAVLKITDQQGVPVASATSPVTVLPGEPALVRQRLTVPRAQLWSTDTPHLYTCVVSVQDADGAAVDAARADFGIRTLQLDHEHGLRINAEPVKLRGACLHHDNGPLGAATWAGAEMRRVQLLREAGFNALRMSHHPMSPAMLDACDRIGMLVMDEFSDVWTNGKNATDYSLDFVEWWERDVEAMVVKDRNRPSVIMYSIGNEIPEIGQPGGLVWSRRLTEKVRALDPTRYVTNGVNGMLAAMEEILAMAAAAGADAGEGTGINTLMAGFAAGRAIGTSEIVTSKTEEAFAMLDVAGMNYLDGRYVDDLERFPNRIIVGSETYASEIDTIWATVTAYPHVLGDFTWTGWDYLGEVGIGRPQYQEDGPGGISAPFPHLVAECGDIDITGHRRAASYYRQIVFGLRSDPYIAVQRPANFHKTWDATPWAWSDSISSWSWPGNEGAPIRVEVYADADEVELYLDGHSLGTAPAGIEHRYRAVFTTTYRPGDLVAVARRDGQEVGRHSLRTAGPDTLLQLDVETFADLAFVAVAVTDTDGVLHTAAEQTLHLHVSGEGDLLALGSARPNSLEPFTAAQHGTYEGRALAVIRLRGSATVAVSSPDCPDATATLRL